MNSKETSKEVEMSDITEECTISYKIIIRKPINTKEEKLYVFTLMRRYVQYNCYKENIMEEMKYIEYLINTDTIIDIFIDLYAQEDSFSDSLIKFFIIETICYSGVYPILKLNKIIEIIARRHNINYLINVLSEKDSERMNAKFDTFIIELRLILGYLEEFTREMNLLKQNKTNVFKSPEKKVIICSSQSSKISVTESLHLATSENNTTDDREVTAEIQDANQPIQIDLKLFDFSKIYFDEIFYQISSSNVLETDMAFLFALSCNISLLTNEYIYLIARDILGYRNFSISEDLLTQIYLEIIRVMSLKQDFYKLVRYTISASSLALFKPTNQEMIINQIYKLIIAESEDIQENHEIISCFRESFDLIHENQKYNAVMLKLYYRLISKFSFGAKYQEFHTLFVNCPVELEIIEYYAEFIAKNDVQTPLQALISRYNNKETLKFYTHFLKNMKILSNVEVNPHELEYKNIRDLYNLSLSDGEIEYITIKAKTYCKDIALEYRKYQEREKKKHNNISRGSVNTEESIKITESPCSNIMLEFFKFILEKKSVDFVYLLNIVPYIPYNPDTIYAVYEIYLLIFAKNMQWKLLFFNMKTPILLSPIINVSSLNKEVYLFMTNKVLVEERNNSKIAYMAIIYHSESAKLNNFDYKGIFGYLSNEYVLMQLKNDLKILFIYIHKNMKVRDESFLINYIYNLLKTVESTSMIRSKEICADILKIVIKMSQSAKHNLYFHCYINYLMRDNKCMIAVYESMLSESPNSNITDYMICNFGNLTHLQKFIDFRGDLRLFLSRNTEIVKKIVNFPFPTKKSKNKLEIIKGIIYNNICTAQLKSNNKNIENNEICGSRQEYAEPKKIMQVENNLKFDISLNENLQLFRKLYSTQKHDDLGWFIDVFLLKPKNRYITELMMYILKIRITIYRNIQDLFILLRIGNITKHKISNLYLFEFIKNNRHAKSEDISKLADGMYQYHFHSSGMAKEQHNGQYDALEYCFFYNLYFFDSIKPQIAGMKRLSISNRHKHGLIEISNAIKTIWAQEKLNLIYTCNRIGITLKENKIPILNEYVMVFEELSDTTTRCKSTEILTYMNIKYRMFLIDDNNLQRYIKDQKEKHDTEDIIETLVSKVKSKKIYTYVCFTQHSIISSFSLSLLDAINIFSVSPVITNYMLQQINREAFIFLIPQMVQHRVRIEDFNLDERVKNYYIWNLRSNGKPYENQNISMDLFNRQEQIFHGLKVICDELKMMNREQVAKNQEFLHKELVSLNMEIETSKCQSGDKGNLESYEIYLPTDPNFGIKAIIPSSSRCLKSNRMPIIVSFISTEDKIKRVIVKKGDDLRQDMLALQVMEMFNWVFSEADLKIKLLPYKVVSLDKDFGMIEMIENAVTRDQIGREEINNLCEYFEFKFGYKENEKYKSAITSFLSTYVGYCLFNYFLNIKDRHNANIMIDDKGHLIHIDFGYMLELSPGNIQFEIPLKLTSEIYELIESEFESYRSMMVSGFLALRRRYKELVLILDAFKNTDIPCFKKTAIENFTSRFHLYMTDLEIEAYVHNMIDKAKMSRITWLYDKYQAITNDIMF